MSINLVRNTFITVEITEITWQYTFISSNLIDERSIKTNMSGSGPHQYEHQTNRSGDCKILRLISFSELRRNRLTATTKGTVSDRL